jgi:hypothetical protein
MIAEGAFFAFTIEETVGPFRYELKYPAREIFQTPPTSCAH